ncbi:hypothetical protein SK128_004810 [Halocaridina rubra]|uniref:Immunoglobulin subtype domain-containing protein n=1 Tax=Halocaridina rubra TaxID=373956 RepID=A0AAN8XB50_HALRR
MKLTLTVLVIALATLGHAEIVISDFIPRENSFFDLRCPLGEDEILKYWLLHGEGQAYMPSVTVTEEEFTVYENGSIIFKRIQTKYAGTHLCVKESPGSIMAHPVTLQVRPLPPTDLWSEVYESQFLTGLIAAVVCFSIFALSCLVYNKRWKPVKTGSDTSPIVENGYDNPAMSGTEEEERSSTKM